jgi:hypothetical protein
MSVKSKLFDLVELVINSTNEFSSVSEVSG